MRLLLLLLLPCSSAWSFWPARSARSAHVDAAEPVLAPPPRLSAVDALVVGGGPAGLAAAIVLAREGARVAVVEQRDVGKEFELQRAYLYLLDGRGQAFTDAYGLTEALEASGVNNERFNLTRVWPDAKRGAQFAKTLLRPGGNNATLPAAGSNSSVGRAGVWIPRASFLQLLDEAARAEGVELLYNTSFAGLRFSEDAGEGGAEAMLEPAEGDAYQLRAHLVLGCDGLRSKVRDTMGEVYAAGTAEVPQRRRLKSLGKRAKVAQRLFQPVPLPSPSSGLHYKMLLFPPSFPARDLKMDSTFQTESEKSYVIPSKTSKTSEALRLGLLPSKDPELPRTANIIRRPDHKIWSISDADRLMEYLGTEFPQLDIPGLLPREEAETFVQSRAGIFPPPQFVRGLVASHSTGAGLALLGDSIHAFPPDIGQGVNAALEDVMDFRKALHKGIMDTEAPANVVDTLRTPERLGAVLATYQKSRAPEAEAVARIARVGFPYQYAQSKYRAKLFFLGFAFRKGVNILAKCVGLGFLLNEPVILQIQSGKRGYAAAWRRAQRTTGLLKAGVVAGALYWGIQQALMQIV